MSSSKYLSVIHESTGDIVSAWKFENDATWIGRDKDKLIATPIYCKSNEKVSMIFVKTFSKQNGKIVHGYFRSTPGETNLLDGPTGESDSHRTAKENIYSGICSGEIKIDGNIINKDLIKDIKIEYRIGFREYIIPDVIIVFKEVHPKYGLGIFFEIQLSNQPDNKTDERSYQRVIEGFSGVWLFKKDFLENMKFGADNVDIVSHKKLLLELEKKMENDFITRINYYGEIIDNKLKNFGDEITNTTNNSFHNYRNRVEETHNNSCKILTNIRKEIEDKSSTHIDKIIDAKNKLEEVHLITSNLDMSSFNKEAERINDSLRNTVTMAEKELDKVIGRKISEISICAKDINVDKIVDELILEIGEKCRENKSKIISRVWER